MLKKGRTGMTHTKYLVIEESFLQKQNNVTDSIEKAIFLRNDILKEALEDQKNLAYLDIDVEVESCKIYELKEVI